MAPVLRGHVRAVVVDGQLRADRDALPASELLVEDDPALRVRAVQLVLALPDHVHGLPRDLARVEDVEGYRVDLLFVVLGGRLDGFEVQSFVGVVHLSFLWFLPLTGSRGILVYRD